MDQCYLHVKTVVLGVGPKGPIGSPVSFPKRSNPAWRLVPPLELIQKVSTKRLSLSRIKPTSNQRRDPGEAEGARKGSVTAGLPGQIGLSRYAEGSAA